MIAALARAEARDWEAIKASRQKKDALFELATRIAILAEKSRSSGSAFLAKAVASERRKALKAGLAIIAEGGDVEELDRALATAAADTDAGPALEARLVRSGLRGLIAGEHPYTLMRRMTAQLGPEYFDKAGEWILARIKRRRPGPDSLVVPGELPDVVRGLALDPRSLERALRAAGREIAAASLAGCPQESMELAKPLYGRVGGAVLEDDAAFLRSRLSGDEIAQAQAAFLEIARGLEERGELDISSGNDLEPDPAFVSELTKAIMSLDDELLRLAFRAGEGKSLAAAMQGMEPRAHDRILGALPKKDMKRILDAIDEAAPLGRKAIIEAGAKLAVLLLDAARERDTSPARASAAKRATEGKSAAEKAARERLERIKNWQAATA
jgi:hypothetical protein